jgi:sulfatase maturation enzyme AslB (radical SAM superfamily)
MSQQKSKPSTPLQHNDAFTEITINLNEECNFRCTYCFIPKQPKFMTVEESLPVCKSVKTLLADGGKIHFFGTEPMLSYPLLMAMVEWFKKNMGKQFTVSMTTNGSLIDKTKAKWLKSNNFSVLLSCDGIAEAHDLHRVSNIGDFTHSKVVRGWDNLLDSGIVPAIAATVTPDTVKMVKDSAAFLLGRSQQFVHFNLDTTHSGKWNTWELYKHWLDLASWYNEEGYKLGILRNFLQVKKAYMRTGGAKPDNRVTCGACQKSIGIDSDSSIKPCHRSNLQSIGELNENGITIFNDKFLKIRNYDFNQCHSCPAYPCSTCYSNFQDATGDIYALNQEWCKTQLVKWQVNEIIFKDVVSYATLRD